MPNEPIAVPTPSPAPRALGSAGAARRKPVRSTNDVTLRETVRSVLDEKWLVGSFVVAAVAAAVAYVLLSPPVYRALALIQVADPPVSTGLERISPLFELKSSADGEMQILRSRLVLAPVVEQLALDVEAEPRRAALIGDALARRHRGTSAAPAPGRALSRFGWGGERIDLARLEVPASLIDSPLTLTSGAHATYRVTDRTGALLVDGKAGELAKGVAGGGPVEILVTSLVARPGTEFRIEKRSRDSVIDELQAAITVSERGKSGVVVVELYDSDPVRAATILNELTATYLRQNVERRTAEAAKTLEFVESQLPSAKGNLDSAEAALTRFRVKHRSIDLSLEGTALIDRAAKLDTEVSTVSAELAQASRHYGAGHPDVLALQRKLEATRAERAGLDVSLRELPETQLAAARLMRQVSVATELYTLLLDRQQSLRVAKSGTIGDVRILDQPSVPRTPVGPKKARAVLVALVLGLGAGIVAAVTKRLVADAVNDSRDVEAATGVPVLVTIPRSEREGELRRRNPRAPAALSVAAPDDPATEQLRTLRTVLGFISKGRRNVVAVSSPSPAAGKTFVCANLAHLLAASGKRVLLVDGDLRRGALHERFGLEAQPGLSAAVSGAATLDESIRTTSFKGLDLLARGSVPASPAEALAGGALLDVLAAAGQRYDIVLVDTPPSLVVTDAVLIGRCAGVNLLVLRGRDVARDLGLALEVFARSGVEIQGAILNDVPPGRGRYYYRHATGQA